MRIDLAQKSKLFGANEMNELDVLREVAARLDAANIPYMLTGSLAMNYYAEPRMTRDIDLVVDLQPGEVEKLVAAFRDDFYVSRPAVEEAVQQRSMFNLIHNETLVKIDFVVRKETPYRKTEFERRRQVRLENTDVYVVSKEDLIVSKIYWARDSRSEVQQRDVRNVMATGYDEAYLEHVERIEPLSICERVAGMNDTAPDVQQMHRERLMARSNEERFLMGISMCQTARAIVWSSLPDDLDPSERRVQFFLRYYGRDLDPALRDKVVTSIRREGMRG